MNVYDSQRMADTLAPEGFVETATPDGADLIILNTCHIREKAADKLYSELGRMRELKETGADQGRRVTLAVAGCVAQAEGKEIFRRNTAVDLVFGPQNYHRLPDLLARAGNGPVVDTSFPAEDKFDHLPAPSCAAMRKRGVSAFVTVTTAATSSARSGRARRAAPKCRGRSQRSSPKPSGSRMQACAKSR